MRETRERDHVSGGRGRRGGAYNHIVHRGTGAQVLVPYQCGWCGRGRVSDRKRSCASLVAVARVYGEHWALAAGHACAVVRARTHDRGCDPCDRVNPAGHSPRVTDAGFMSTVKVHAVPAPTRAVDKTADA